MQICVYIRRSEVQVQIINGGGEGVGFKLFVKTDMEKIAIRSEFGQNNINPSIKNTLFHAKQ